MLYIKVIKADNSKMVWTCLEEGMPDLLHDEPLSTMDRILFYGHEVSGMEIHSENYEYIIVSDEEIIESILED